MPRRPLLMLLQEQGPEEAERRGAVGEDALTPTSLFTQALDVWVHLHGVKLAFSRLGTSTAGTPTDNPYSEAFNGGCAKSVWIQQWFCSLDEARETSRKLEEGLQYRATPHGLRLPDPSRLCHRLVATATKRRNRLTFRET